MKTKKHEDNPDYGAIHESGRYRGTNGIQAGFENCECNSGRGDGEGGQHRSDLRRMRRRDCGCNRMPGGFYNLRRA